MQVLRTHRIDENHSIEFGWSTWNPEVLSIRNRFDRDGHFDPRSSSEISLHDGLEMFVFIGVTIQPLFEDLVRLMTELIRTRVGPPQG